MVISQPCPAIVTYIQIYHPKLIPYLAPADSPMMHTIKMIKRFYPQYSNHKILILSPCIAKKREFQEVGMGDYNVTLKSLTKHIENSRIDISRFPKQDYDNPPAERAVLFSTPGGLLLTALRENPDIIHLSRKIEGPEIIYKYLSNLEHDVEKGYSPLLVDCLNCEMGCNGGTGTVSADKNNDELEFLIAQRSRNAIKEYASDQMPDIHDTINRHWEKNLYKRTYKDLSSNYQNQVMIPTPSQIEEINHKLLKFEKKDSLNCHSCGYLTCEKFAISIFNGLNTIDNCYYYIKRRMKNEYDYLTQNVDQMLSKMKQVSEEHMNAGQKALQGMLVRIQNIVSVVNQTRDTITELETSNGQIGEIIKVIHKITKQTNLLSINASIEATRAGLSGKGFTVVAKEIKKLAEETNKSIIAIQSTVSHIQNSTKDAVNYIQKSSHEVQDGEDMVSQVTTILNKIMNETNEVVKMISNVVDNVKN